MADYFPLLKGYRLEYEYTGSEVEGTAKAVIDILSLGKKGDTTIARARLTVIVKGHITSCEYNIGRNAKGVTTENGIVVGGRKEFPLPIKPGRKWDEYPDANEIVSVKEKVTVPAGEFTKCMKVLTLLSGGDSGSAERWYAPGVGYIKEEYNAEDMQAEIKLTAIRTTPEDEIASRTRAVPKKNKGKKIKKPYKKIERL